MPSRRSPSSSPVWLPGMRLVLSVPSARSRAVWLLGVRIPQVSPAGQDPLGATRVPAHRLTLVVAHHHFVLGGTRDTGPAQPYPPARFLNEPQV